jgi:methylated-DNA-[protein]-cysteine S-methyltransferase
MSSGEALVFTEFDGPLGTLLAVGDGEAVRGMWMQDGPRPRAIDPTWRRDDAAFATLRKQLGEYFAGARRAFDLNLDPQGTEFQRDVWRELSKVGYGETLTYAELAGRLGRAGSARAVGTANASNPICVVIPCHRVLGRDGALTGYAGGLERKRDLLRLEGRVEAGIAADVRSYTLLGAAGRPYESPEPGALGGHRGNRVYGRLDCAGARRWIAKGKYVTNRVFFADEETAIAAGYRPCAGCMPERYREWKAASGSP